jgi:pilus assembly protein CpaE
MLKILVLTRDPARAVEIGRLIASHDHSIAQTSLLGRDVAADVAQACAAHADAIVLCCDDPDLAPLAALATVPPERRPPVVLCGALGSREAARLAVRCGAADLLPAQPDHAEFVAALARIDEQASRRPAGSREAGAITTVIGVAGGVGASFIASNLAHLAVQRDHQSAVLVDLDLLYAPLTAYLGVKPEQGLAQAVDRVESLDTVALGAYVARHPTSGIGLLAGSGDAPYEAGGLPAENFRTLLRMLATQFDRVIVDAPRWLDGATTVALADSRHVLLVLEQSVGNVHNGARLYRVLTRDLGLPRDRVHVVLNRYSRRAAVTTADVERALGCSDIAEVNSEYELARDSLDSAVSVTDRGARSALARALGEVHTRVGGLARTDDGGFLRRALPLFRKGDT